MSKVKEIARRKRSFETASEIEVIENFYQGGLTIHDTQDVDYFKFDQTSTGAVGSYAEILLSEDSGDLDLYLYNSNGFQTVESAGSKETVNLAGLPKDTYTLAIRVIKIQLVRTSYQ